MANEPQLYEDPNYSNDIESADIEDNTTKVGISQSNKIFTFVALAAVLLGVVYFIFSGEDKPEEGVKEQNVSPLEKPRNEDGEIIVDRVPKQPEDTFEPLISNIEPEYESAVDVVPEITIPDLPPVADIEIDIPDESTNILPKVGSDKSKKKVTKSSAGTGSSRLDQLTLQDAEHELDTELDMNDTRQPNAKNYQSIMLINGGGASYTGSGEFVMAESSAESVLAEVLPHPERTIAQGKLIDAVLETAINTDFEGKVRAIVSRDVYGDFGKNIFIPKGSRVIGSYSGTVTASQTRVLITWERLIRPDAVDIKIDSQATDQFGRAGVPGDADNKYLETFNNAVLLSLLTVGSALTLDKITDSEGLTVDEDDDGSTTTSGTATDYAASDLIDTISSTGETILTGLLNVTPTITVPHGTRIKIFVSQDIIFPDVSATSSTANNNGLTIIE